MKISMMNFKDFLKGSDPVDMGMVPLRDHFCLFNFFCARWPYPRFNMKVLQTINYWLILNVNRATTNMIYVNPNTTLP